MNDLAWCHRLLLCALAALLVLPAATQAATPGAAPPAAEGVRFVCTAARLDRIATGMTRFLRAAGVNDTQYQRLRDDAAGTLTYVLATPADDVVTLDLRRRRAFAVQDAVVQLPGLQGVQRVRTVSQQEILLALMQHGRLTEFSGAACDVQALRDHVAIRQLVVAWSENLDWTFPDGGPARWHARWWHHGTPRRAADMEQAFRDVFLHQSRYAFGCYTAAKIVLAQAVLDYFGRVRRDPVRLAQVKARLLADGDPLVDVEPPAMWSFETGFDARELPRPGKLLGLQRGVPAGNFVPGDWTYLVNPDPVSSQRAGYEGSNALYMGRGRFDDFYNDNRHTYTFRQKVDEVYQWQYGVFSRARDAARIHPLTPETLAQLGRSPAEGGIVLDLRAVPYQFGYQALPAWVPPVVQADAGAVSDGTGLKGPPAMP